jgi:eukaryotic-like serine/threonine-protein kinase
LQIRLVSAILQSLQKQNSDPRASAVNHKQRLPGQGPDLQLVTVPMRPLLDDAWTEVSTYLGEALRMEPPAREAWLEDLKRRDPALATQIQLHIAELSELIGDNREDPYELPASALLAVRSGAAGEAQRRCSVIPPQDWAPAAGQKLGAYTLECPIGHGGMGSVWLASRADGRYEGRVAIKLMAAAMRAHISAERITREGQILARLSHPNIARLIDAGVTSQGQPYLVLEYIEGEDIDHWCNSRRLATGQRIGVFLDVLAAVQHAHSQLILHRDLKPSNVLVTREGGVRLLDFGVGKLLDSDYTPDPDGNLAGRNTTLFCTPAYAAPEQVQSGQVSTTATDVYALGVMLYVLLSGRHPTTTLGSTPLEQMRSVVEQDPPRLSDSAIGRAPLLPGFSPLSRREARKLRGDLDNILAKALQKAPAERYGTVGELAADLRRFLENKPVHARPDSARYRLRKFIGRHRGPVVAAAAVFLALVGGVAATTWQALEASQARTLAESQRHAAEEERGEAQFETRNARASQELLSQIFGDAVKGGDDPRMRWRLDHARDLLAQHYAHDPRIYASLLLQLAGRYDELGDVERAAQLRREFSELSARTGDGSLLANSECIQAYTLVGAGQAKEAEGHLARGFDLMHQARQDWAEAGSECYRAGAMLALAQGNHAWAARQMSTWLQILESQGLAQTRSYLSSLASLAHIQQEGDDLPAALRTSQRVLELSDTLGAGDTLAACVNLDRKADILYGLGHLHEALAADGQLEARMRADGSAVPLYMRAQMARRALAAGVPARAMELLKDVPGPAAQGDEAARRAWPILIEARLQHGDPPGAAQELSRYDATSRGQPLSPREALDVSRLHLILPLAYGSYGRNNPHLVSARSALEAAMQGAGLTRVALLNAHITAGLGALASIDLEGARKHAAQALSMAQSQGTEGASAWVGMTRLLQARISQAAGDASGAAAAFSEAREQLEGSVEPQQAWRLDAERNVEGKEGAHRAAPARRPALHAQPDDSSIF